MLLNLSNHHSSTWQEKQIKAAINKYESIIDIEFPCIDPNYSENEIINLAKEYLQKIIPYFSNADKYNAAHIMGEHTFIYALVNLLQKKGIKCVASTTDRISSVEDNKKISEFNFVNFREYQV
jgi:hypothetical protein